MSLKRLLSECPVLTGRADFKTLTVSGENAFVPLEIIEKFPGSAGDYAEAGKNIRNRADFVHESSLRETRNGRSPVMAVRLTRFAKGGCALGVTINHAVMDSRGFHLVMTRWSEIFQSLDSGKSGTPIIISEDVFEFETGRSTALLLDDIERAGKPRPQNYGNLTGRILKSLIFKVLDIIKKRDREMVHLSPSQVESLRDHVRREAGLERLSRNIAVSAHVIHALIPSQTDERETKIKLANVIDVRSRLRGPYLAKQARYAGNAIYLLMGDLVHPESVRHLSRGDIAKAIFRDFNGLTEANIWRDMRNVVDSLNADYGYPGVTAKGAVMGVNNQSKFDVYNVDFGAGRPLRVVPQEVGDHIMMFPAADGGMEIYLRDFTSMKRQKKLLEPEWQTGFMAPIAPLPNKGLTEAA